LVKPFSLKSPFYKGGFRGISREFKKPSRACPTTRFLSPGGRGLRGGGERKIG